MKIFASDFVIVLETNSGSRFHFEEDTMRKKNNSTGKQSPRGRGGREHIHIKQVQGFRLLGLCNWSKQFQPISSGMEASQRRCGLMCDAYLYLIFLTSLNHTFLWSSTMFFKGFTCFNKDFFFKEKLFLIQLTHILDSLN